MSEPVVSAWQGLLAHLAGGDGQGRLHHVPQHPLGAGGRGQGAREGVVGGVGWQHGREVQHSAGWQPIGGLQCQQRQAEDVVCQRCGDLANPGARPRQLVVDVVFNEDVLLTHPLHPCN